MDKTIPEKPVSNIWDWLVQHRLLVLWVVTGILFVYLAYLNDQRVRDVQHLYQTREEANYLGCIQGNVSAARFNTLLDTLADIDRDNPVLTEQVRTRRIAAYEHAKIGQYNCRDFSKPPQLPPIPTSKPSPTPSRS